MESDVHMTVAQPSALAGALGVLGMRQLECGAGGAAEAVLPDSHVILSLQYRDPILSQDGKGPRLLRSHLSGPHARRVDVRAPGAAGAVLVKLHPRAAAMLFRTEVRDLASDSVTLEDLAGRSQAQGLEDRLAGAANATSRFAIVEMFLAERRRDDRSGPDLAHAAFDILAAGDGTARIDHVAGRLDVSVRWLEQRFAQAFGLTPKTMARILRLQGALKARAAVASWSAVAADAGFADQAHLTREFRAMVGASPKAFYAAVARLEAHALNRATSRSDFFNTFFA